MIDVNPPAARAMKKYMMLEIAPEDMVPELAELVAFAQEVVDDNNAIHEENVALRQELVQLRKAKKQRAST